MLNGNTLLARKVQQHNQEYFVGIFSIQQILTFTKFTERLIVSYDEWNQPIYNSQIQRKVENSRVEKIADFLLDDPDALFPTNLVLSIPNAAIESIEEINTQTIKIELSKRVFVEVKKPIGDIYITIIDGQHRIRGIERALERIRGEIENYQKVLANSGNEEFQKKLGRRAKLLTDLLNINLLVTFFLDATLEFQAMVFSTINRTQKSVPQSLVYSLFGLNEKDSPQKSALQIVLALNGFEKSPFFNRIRLHGGKYERNQSPPLTQAGIVRSIIDLISINLRESERDRFRERNELLINCGPEVPFRRYYANNQDSLIIDILFSFYSAVKETFVVGSQSLWDFEDNKKPSNILQTTVGYEALLLLLIDILTIEDDDEKRDKVNTYRQYLIKARNLDFGNIERYPFTSRSKTVFHLDLSLSIWPPKKGNDERLLKLSEILKK